MSVTVDGTRVLRDGAGPAPPSSRRAHHRRTRTLLLGGILAIVVGSVPWVVPTRSTPVSLVALATWVGLFGLLVAASPSDRFDRPLRRQGPAVVVGMVLALVLLTGGTTSPYAALHLPVVGFMAAFRGTRDFLVVLALATAAWLAPVLIAPSKGHAVDDVVVALAAGLTFFVLHLLAASSRAAVDTYLHVLRNHAGPAWVLDRAGTMSWVNDAAEDVLGLPLAAVVDRPWQDLVAPGEAARIAPAFEAALAGRAQAIDVRTQAPGGRHHLRGTLFPVRREGRVVEVMGLAADVTVEAVAAFGATALQRVIEQFATPVLVLDLEDRACRYANRAATEFLGSITGERVVDPCEVSWAHLPDDLRGHLVATDGLDRLRLRGRPDTVGVAIDWEVTLHRLQDGRDLVAIAAVDTSERARRERTLSGLVERERESVERLRSVEASRSAFLAATSHELRTPLTLILGAAGTLVTHRAELDPADRVRLEEALLSQARRLDAMVGELLDVAGRDPGPAQREEVDVSELVRDVVERSPGRELTRVRGATPLVARVDRAKFERILSNLLDNAARHAPGAPVAVEVEGLADGGVRLQVTDRGPGIAPAELDRIFEPFHRLDPHHPRPGFGVGLAIVSDLAAAHGGRASARSDVGEGATFTVELPAMPDADRG